MADPPHSELMQPINRINQLHQNIEELHQQRMDKTNQRIVKPIAPMIRPPLPITDANQPAYYGAPVAPVLPHRHQYNQQINRHREHPLSPHSHPQSPVVRENGDYQYII